MSIAFSAYRNDWASRARYSNRVDVCDSEFSLWGHQYSNISAHMTSLSHPFYHLARVLMDSARLLKGALLLMVSPLSCDGLVICWALSAFLAQAVTIVMDIINCINSVVSVVTSTLMTLFSGGYLEYNLNQAFSGKEVGGRNFETTGNMLGAFFASAGSQSNKTTEEVCHQLTCGL